MMPLEIKKVLKSSFSSTNFFSATAIEFGPNHSPGALLPTQHMLWIEYGLEEVSKNRSNISPSSSFFFTRLKASASII
jgi:hypothetical protein